MSVLARILNRAKARGDDYQTLLALYALERFLHRLGRDPKGPRDSESGFGLSEKDHRSARSLERSWEDMRRRRRPPLMLPSPRRTLFLSLVLGASTVACAGSREQERREIQELGERHDRAQSEFLASQAEFLARNAMPVRLDYPGIGTLVIHEAELGGRLGLEHFHTLFTWVNTTSGTTNGARVRVVIRNARGDIEREQRVDLRSLLGAGFCPDSSYTSFVDLPTGDLHLQPGWDWRVEVEPIPIVLAPATAAGT